MPPQIALILCIIFISFFFIRDFKRKLHFSNALWIPQIWIMIAGSRLVSQWLNPGTGLHSSQAYIEGSPIDRAFFSILIFTALFILSRRKIFWSQILRKNACIFLFYSYGAISILWSDFPIVAFKRWIKSTGNLVMVLVVLTDPDPVEAVRTIIKRFTYVLIPLSILFIKYFPHLGWKYSPWGELEFLGVANSKNTLGNLCLVTGYFFIWDLLTILLKKNVNFNKKEIFFNILFLFMIIWLLMKIDSATSLICLIIGICILLGLEFQFLKKNVQYIGWFIIFLAFCFMMLILFWGFGSFLSSFVNITGHSDTFWGRAQIWPVLIDMIKTSPLYGAGFESFWLGERLKTIWTKFWWQPNQAHNGYIEIYINLGLIGLILLIGIIFSSYRNIRSSLVYNFEHGKLRMGFLIMALMYNITEAAVKGISLVWITFLLLIVDCPSPCTGP